MGPAPRAAGCGRRSPTLIDVGGRVIGPGHPCFVIAEAGVNHNGDPALAKALIDSAADAGADAIKFQSFRADELASPIAPKAPYQVENTGNAGSQIEMLRGLELPDAVFRELRDHSRARGVLFMSTPFDEASADMLHALDVPAFKIGSGELTNTVLLEHVALLGRPVILSTGMSWLSEVETAVRTLQRAGVPGIALLHCVSCYPAAPIDINLRAMETLRSAFGLPVGYSDHSDGTEIGVAAVALGADIIEKHLTLDRALLGPDHRASLDPAAMTSFVTAIRNVEVALGHGRKEPVASERAVADAARRSLVAACFIPAGTVLTAAMLLLRRPGTGLPLSAQSEVIGRAVGIDVEPGTPLTRGMLE